MDNWIIVVKLAIIIYCALRYSSGDAGNVSVVILVLLFYMCINMIYHLIKKRVWKKVSLVLAVILLLGSFMYVDGLFILLLPINICEIFFIFGAAYWIPISITLTLTLLIDRSILREYLLVSVFSYLIIVLSSIMYKRVDALLLEIDDLREKNNNLYNRLNRDVEYERQIKSLSQLEERNKIAQEIHDKVGHSISGSLMQLEAIKLLVDKDSEKAKDMLQSIITVLREGMESIRSTLRNIKPAAEQLGFNRLKLILDEFAAKNLIKVNFHHKGNMEVVSFIQWKVVCENIGEALTNAVKYSRATSISVGIEILNKYIKVEVKDNGIGAYSFKKGLGITGIEERTGNLGGKVIIDGSSGFSIITLLPVEEGNHGNKTFNS